MQPGVFYNADVYQGVPELPRGIVKYLRVFQQDAKTYSTWEKTFVFSGPAVSAVQTEAVKRIVSIVPVEADGSVYFEAPAGESLYFQLLDEHYRALHTMRSFTGVMPGERRGCVGCHEMHSTAPPPASFGIGAAASADRAEPATLGHREHRLRAIRPARAGSLLRRVPPGRGRSPQGPRPDARVPARVTSRSSFTRTLPDAHRAGGLARPDAHRGPTGLRHRGSDSRVRLASRATRTRTTRPPTRRRRFTERCGRCGISRSGAG